MQAALLQHDCRARVQAGQQLLSADRRQMTTASPSVEVQDAQIRRHQLELMREVDTCQS